MSRKKTHAQFVAELAAISPSIEVLGTYTASVNRVKVRCGDCGCEWSPVAAELTRGRGCPSCKGHKPLTQEEFVKRMGEANPDVEIVGEYVRSNVKVECRCRKCGHIWLAVPGSLLSGHGCPDCANRSNGKRRRKTHGRFVTELAEVNPDIEVVGRYKNSASPVDVRCRICGHEWSPIARSIVNAGQGCPVCNRKRAAEKNRKSPQSFVERMREVNPNIKIIGEYKGNKDKIAVSCLICGHNWKAAPSNLLQGHGCPRCAKTGTSFMEQFLCVFFENLIGSDGVLSRDKTAIGRELDIFLPVYNYAIEIGSWFWHADRLSSDIAKERECAEAGIELLTIYDSYSEANCRELPRSCVTYDYSLGDEKGHETLHRLALSIASKLADGNNQLPTWSDIEADAITRSRRNGACNAGAIDFEHIEKEAVKRVTRRTTEEFVAELSGINPDVEVLGDFVGTKTKILCRCRICGHEWSPTPGQLLIGQGCPPCGTKRAIAKTAEKRRKSPKEYEEDFKAANPTLVLLSEYKGSLKRVNVRCKICGHEWSPRAEAVIRGNGCPVCADSSKRKTQEAFLAELSEINPDIEVLGEYVKSSTPIECRCKKCGHIWRPRPSKLLHGRGCPKCAGKMKMAVRCIETGEIFESYAAAAAAMGLSSGDTISAVCKGKRKTAAGHTWEHVQKS